MSTWLNVIYIFITVNIITYCLMVILYYFQEGFTLRTVIYSSFLGLNCTGAIILFEALWNVGNQYNNYIWKLQWLESSTIFDKPVTSLKLKGLREYFQSENVCKQHCFTMFNWVITSTLVNRVATTVLVTFLYIIITVAIETSAGK